MTALARAAGHVDVAVEELKVAAREVPAELMEDAVFLRQCLKAFRQDLMKLQDDARAATVLNPTGDGQP